MITKKIAVSRWLKLVIKILVTLICGWYLASRLDFKATWALMKQASSVWILTAAIFFALSKWVSALRLQFYFKNIKASISHKANLRLYWLGMFYNLFLPGGIGGDAYKVILLKRSKGYDPKSLTAAVLLDRVSGVAALGILATINFFILFYPQQVAFYAVASAAVGLVLLYLFVKKIFPSFHPSFFTTFWLGLLVQCLQICCIWAIMHSLNIENAQTEYLLLFLVSSVIAILPFTIGGLGAREVVFLWGSTYFALTKETSVSISLLFYLITVFVSLPGIFWVFVNPLTNKSKALNKI